MIWKPVLLFTLFFSNIAMAIFANSTLSFFQLSHLNDDAMLQYHQKDIEIRGFLYKTEDGRWILASEPNLKTCCVASQSKIKKQIFLVGDCSRLVPTTCAITISGKFCVDPKTNSQGILVELYHLKLEQT